MASPSATSRVAAVKWNVLPGPVGAVGPIRPPSARRGEEIARPVRSSCRRVSVPSTLFEGVEDRAMLFLGDADSGIARTEKWSVTSRLLARSMSTSRTTSPCSVNLIALPTRFTTICRIRLGSPREVEGTSAAKRRAAPDPVCAPADEAIASCRRGLHQFEGKAIRASRPASILEKSRISLITASSDSPSPLR